MQGHTLFESLWGYTPYEQRLLLRVKEEGRRSSTNTGHEDPTTPYAQWLLLQAKKQRRRFSNIIRRRRVLYGQRLLL